MKAKNIKNKSTLVIKLSFFLEHVQHTFGDDKAAENVYRGKDNGKKAEETWKTGKRYQMNHHL